MNEYMEIISGMRDTCGNAIIHTIMYSVSFALCIWIIKNSNASIFAFICSRFFSLSLSLSVRFATHRVCQNQHVIVYQAGMRGMNWFRLETIYNSVHLAYEK